MKAKTRGKIRWEVEWQELTASAKHRRDLHPDEYEHDRDNDEQNIHQVFDTIEKAREYALKIVRSGVTCYGHATVQEEHYLPIEGTIHFDWEPMGDPEYVDRTSTWA